MAQLDVLRWFRDEFGVHNFWCTRSGPKSQGKEAATGTLGKKIGMTPALEGSLSKPERQEARVGIPESITQSWETQELAAEQLNRVDMGISQKVAEDGMRRSKGEVCWPNKVPFDFTGWEAKARARM
ncbi:hypothetical protein DFH06DRAFT_1123377 [Mycena polygramma]|nr:hypothetical protein DFH06DRAFT_1123377 [Mycena polygramma]